MEKRDVGSLRGLARRLLRETAGAQTYEAALFAGAVLAASVFAFSATDGSMGRVMGRISSAFGCANAGQADLDAGPSSAEPLHGAGLLVSVSQREAPPSR